MAKALLIIDVQKGMFAVGDPYNGSQVIKALGTALEQARSTATPVFYVQHEGDDGHPLARNGEGFPIHDAIAPLPDDHVTIKRHCNAFQGTDLFEVLEAAGIDELVIGGMQTEFCVDTAVRGAFERGFSVTLIADGHTTFGTVALSAERIVAHHNHTLSSGHFAKVVASGNLKMG